MCLRWFWSKEGGRGGRGREKGRKEERREGGERE